MKRILIIASTTLIVALAFGCQGNNQTASDYYFEQQSIENALEGYQSGSFEYIAAKYFLSLAIKDYETSESLIGFRDDLRNIIPPDLQRALYMLRDTPDLPIIYKIEKLPRGYFGVEGSYDYAERIFVAIHYYYADDRNVTFRDIVILKRENGEDQWYIYLPVFAG